MQLQAVFHRLADLATIFVTFDHILGRSALADLWPSFDKAIASLHDNIDQLPAGSYAEPDVGGLRLVLADMRLLFGGDLFQTFVNALQSARMSIPTASLLAQHWDAYLRAQLHRIETGADAVAGQLSDFVEARDVVRLTVASVMLHCVHGRLDAALAARMFEVNVRHSGVTLVEHFQWMPEEFVARHLVYASKSAAAKAVAKYCADAGRLRNEVMRKQFAEVRLGQMAQTLCARVLMWQLQVGSEVAGEKAGCDGMTGATLTARATMIGEVSGIGMGDTC